MALSKSISIPTRLPLLFSNSKGANVVSVAMMYSSEFELLESGRDRNTFYDFYCLYRPVPLEQIRLLPGETDNVMWASFGKVHWMIRTGKICRVIAHQFRRQEKWLRLRSFHKDKA